MTEIGPADFTAALKRGDQVSLVGFGTFSVKNRAGREGRNPRTGETIQIHVKLVEQEKRRLTFEARVVSPRGAISVGRHQRAIVDLSRFST